MAVSAANIYEILSNTNAFCVDGNLGNADQLNADDAVVETVSTTKGSTFAPMIAGLVVGGGLAAAGSSSPGGAGSVYTIC